MTMKVMEIKYLAKSRTLRSYLFEPIYFTKSVRLHVFGRTGVNYTVLLQHQITTVKIKLCH